MLHSKMTAMQKAQSIGGSYQTTPPQIFETNSMVLAKMALVKG